MTMSVMDLVVTRVVTVIAWLVTEKVIKRILQPPPWKLMPYMRASFRPHLIISCSGGTVPTASACRSVWRQCGVSRIKAVAVDPDFRRRRIGAALVQACTTVFEELSHTISYGMMPPTPASTRSTTISALLYRRSRNR